MTGKHRRALTALFTIPTHRGERVYLHRPHPEHEAKRYQVEKVREFLRRLEIRP